MNIVRNGLTASAITLLLSLQPAAAHHSSAAEYDSTKLVTITGTVSKIAWANPHCRIYVDAKDEKGVKQTWDFELQSVNSLIRRGWNRNSVKVGDAITVQAERARDGSTRGNARDNISTVDGKKLFNGASARDE